MAAGDVNSRLMLNTRQFNTGLTAGQKRLEQFGEAGIRIFERLSQVAQEFQNTTQNLKFPEIRPNVTVNIRDSGVSTYRAEVDGASVSVAGLGDETERLGNAAAKVKPKLEGAGAGAETVGRGSDRAVGGVDRLHDSMDRLQQVGALLLSGAGLFTYFRRLEGAAGTQQTATTNLNLYNRELVKANETGEDGQAVLDELAKRFKVNSSAIAGDAAGILRYGANLEQTSEILLRAGASAVIRRRAFTDGANAANEALNGEYSAALNLIGVSGNLSTYFQRMAKEQRTTVDLLTRQQKVEAFLNLLRAETGTEVEALSELYVDYAAALQRVNTSQLTASQETGAVVIPALTALKNIYADLLDLYSALPTPVQALAVGTATLVVVTGALVVGYVSLRALLFNQRTLGPIILDLLKNETVARGRLGAAILAQAQAYGLLNKSQLKTAQASIDSAKASAAAAASAKTLMGVLKTPIKGAGFLTSALALGTLVAIVREATNYMEVFRPIIDSVAESFAGVNVSGLVQGLSDAVAGGELFVAAFKNGVLYTVTFLSLSLEELSFQYERSMLVAKKWGQQTRLDGEGAAATQREIDALKESHVNNQNAILDSAAAYETQNTNAYLAASGLAAYGEGAASATAKTRQLTEEQKTLRNGFKERLDALEPEVDTTTLKGQITEATQEIDALITELGAEIEKLPLGDLLRGQLEGFLQTAKDARKTQVGAIYAEALVEAEEEATDATLSAMQDGAAKIETQRDRDLAAAEEAFKDRTAGLKEGSERYQEFLTLYNQQETAIRTRAAADLQANAQERLDSARELREQIDSVAADLAQSQAEGSDDALVGLRAQFTRTADSIRTDTQQLLRDVERARQEQTLSDAEAAAETVRINNLQTVRLQQNQRELSEAQAAELQRRANFVEDHYSAVRAYEAAYAAERQRNAGNDVGAVQTELAERLRLIAEGLKRELQTEGLTRAQITAVNQKAEADRVQARREAGRQIDAIMQGEVGRERAFQNELRGIRQQDTIDAAQDAGQVRAAAAAEYEKSVSDLQASLDEQLAAVGLSEDEKTEIHRVAQAKREALDAGYSRTLSKLAEDEAQVVADSADAAGRARIDAIEGSLPRMVRQFKQEQAERRQADQEALESFEGTQQQRQQLVAQSAQREATIAKGFSAQLLREQKAVLQTYFETRQGVTDKLEVLQRDAQARELELEKEAQERRVSYAQDLLELRRKQTDRGGLQSLGQENEAYNSLAESLRGNVDASEAALRSAQDRANAEGKAAQQARDSGAAQQEVAGAQQGVVEAQKAVIAGLEQQISRVRQLRDEQLAFVKSGGDVLEYYRESARLSGRGENEREVTSFLKDQQQNLYEVLQAQKAANAPVSERLATLKEIGQLEDELGKRGEGGLSRQQRDVLGREGLGELKSFPDEAARAVDSVQRLQGEMVRLATELAAAQAELANLLESFSGGAGQAIQITIEIDTSELAQQLADAQQELAAGFGKAAAERINQDFANGLSVSQVLEKEMAAAGQALQTQTETVGLNSGQGFMRAFADGISGAGSLVEQALKGVLSPVRELLPSSDAKRGPLSDLTYSGGKTVTTYAGGLERKLPDLTRVVSKMAATVRPLNAVSTLQVLPGSGGAGGGGDQYHNYYLGDGMIPVDDLTRMDGARFGRSLIHTLKNRSRMGHRPPLRGGKRR